MSGSGVKSVVINTQERALSVDINRLQALNQASYMQMLREWLLSDAATTTGTPLRAEVLSGLYAKPVNGSFQLQVAAGSMVCVETPATPDDDPLHLAVQSVDYNNPALAVLPNVSGFARIDLLECQRTEVVLETDSRDIFNDTTGLFTAATVTKVKGSGMQFRVRAGTPAGGVPAPATGWLPLTAILVPNGAASLDTCTLWDIRPLLTDTMLGADGVTSRVSGDFGVSEVANVDAVVGAMSGRTVWTFRNRTIGGEIQTTSPGTLKKYINVPAESSPGFAPADGQMIFGYLCFPGGYPRWARYTDSGARVPSTFRGVYCTSVVVCDDVYAPVASIALPTATGLGTATVSQATCIYAGIWNLAGVCPKPFNVTDGWITFAWPAGAPQSNVLSAAALGLSSNFVLNTHYPAPVRGLSLFLTKKISVSNAFFAANLGIIKRFKMSFDLEYAAPLYGGGSGELNFADQNPIGMKGNANFSDVLSASVFAERVPLVPMPTGTSRPTIAILVPSDNTYFMDVPLGTAIDYGATPVSPLTQVAIAAWKFA